MFAMEVIELDPLTEFFEAIRSPLTKDRYDRRLDLFFVHIKMDGENLRQRARAFASKANSLFQEVRVMSFAPGYQGISRDLRQVAQIERDLNGLCIALTMFLCMS